MVEPLLAFAGSGLNPQREGKACFTNGFLHNAWKSTCLAIAALEIFMPKDGVILLTTTAGCRLGKGPVF